MRRLGRALVLLTGSGFPWPGQRRDPWSVAGRRAILCKWPQWARPLAWLGMVLSWPGASLFHAIAIARHTSAGPRGLWLSAWRAALFRNVPPREFLHYQLWRPGALSQPWSFERETSALLSLQTDAKTARLIADKAAFTQWLSDREIPCVPVITALPEGDFVVKPRRGVCGAGITAWSASEGGYDGRPAFGNGNWTRATKAELAQTISREDVIVQPRVWPDPILGQALVARIVSARDAGTTSILMALVQTPATGDFCSQRGVFRLVDVDTGRILPPGPGQMTHPLHASPADFLAEGAVLPAWGDLVEHLRRAHQALPGPVPVVGWDVIFGTDGPQVLEGNTAFGLLLFQLDRLEPAILPLPGCPR